MILILLVFMFISYIIVSAFNFGYSIKSRIDHPFIDVHLIERIPKVPANILTDNILDRVLGLFKEAVNIFHPCRYNTEEGILVRNPLIH